MKHIFYIHSNITYLAALAIIKEKKLTEPVLLFGRNYTNSLIVNDYQKVYLNKEIDSLNFVPSSGTPWLAFKYYISLKQTKLLINKYGSKEFECYLPHVKNFLMQFFVMHSKCMRYNIMDEGLLSYTNPVLYIKQTDKRFTENFKGKIIRLLKYVNHVNSSSVYSRIKARLGKIYLFYNDSTRDWKEVNVQIMEWPALSIDIPDYSNKNIYILDNLENDSFLDIRNYSPILMSIFNHFKNKELHIKFHPANKNYDIILNLLKKTGVKYNIIDSNTPIELVILNSENVKIFGLFSSLLFYAAIMGHDSYSFAKYSEPYDVRISPMMAKLMPPVFFEKVKMI